MSQKNKKKEQSARTSHRMLRDTAIDRKNELVPCVQDDGGMELEHKNLPQLSDEEKKPDSLLICLGNALANALPLPPPELIEGILRKGHKMVISGDSKAGKSFMLIELAIAIASGTEWLGFACRKSRVLYVNLEVEGASCVRRFKDIYDVLDDVPLDSAKDIMVLNLRGHAKPLDEIAPDLIKVIQRYECDVLIIDPIYKVITGDENSASDMAHFCNQFDMISSQTGCSVIYCHHHNKSANASTNAGNRLSGSGVFTRDVDALLDIVQLKWDEDDGATAWRIETVLREFPNKKPINMWFTYPVHIIDKVGDLDDAEFEQGASATKKSKKSLQDKLMLLDKAYDACKDRGIVKVSDIARKMGCSDKSVRRYITLYNKDKYSINQGIVLRVEKP